MALEVIEKPKKTVIYEHPGFATQYIELDATIREDFSQSARVTELNIEEGSIINDHIISGPKRLVLDGIVSDTPIDDSAGLFEAIGESIGNVFNGEDAKSPSSDAYNMLLGWVDKKVQVNISTGREEYENYVITRMSLPFGQDTGHALEVNLTLMHITTIDLDSNDDSPAETKAGEDVSGVP